MRKIVATTAAIIIAGMTLAAAQQNHSHTSAQGSAPQVSDGREFVQFPAPLVEHTLANMRDHLAAIQEIQQHLGMGNIGAAASIAENRLGMSSLGMHGAHEVSKFMPQGMQDAGSAMHKAASQFVIVAQDADVAGDMKPVFSALANITAACVGCHAGYRIK